MNEREAEKRRIINRLIALALAFAAALSLIMLLKLF